MPALSRFPRSAIPLDSGLGPLSHDVGRFFVGRLQQSNCVVAVPRVLVALSAVGNWLPVRGDEPPAVFPVLVLISDEFHD